MKRPVRKPKKPAKPKRLPFIKPKLTIATEPLYERLASLYGKGIVDQHFFQTKKANPHLTDDLVMLEVSRFLLKEGKTFTFRTR